MQACNPCKYGLLCWKWPSWSFVRMYWLTNLVFIQNPQLLQIETQARRFSLLHMGFNYNINRPWTWKQPIDYIYHVDNENEISFICAWLLAAPSIFCGVSLSFSYILLRRNTKAKRGEERRWTREWGEWLVEGSTDYNSSPWSHATLTGCLYICCTLVFNNGFFFLFLIQCHLFLSERHEHSLQKKHVHVHVCLYFFYFQMIEVCWL